MLIVTTDTIPGKDIKEVLGFVSDSTVRSKHIGKDIGASLKTIVGGEIISYNEMMTEARQIAVSRMVEQAKKMGANAIIGMRLGTSSVMQGACEVIAYGTAVVID